MLSLNAELRNQTIVYKSGTDRADDSLLNPGYLLVGEKASNAEEATKFAKWLVSQSSQDIVTGFEKNGEQLYSGAP